jgi:hypothetical protein
MRFCVDGENIKKRNMFLNGIKKMLLVCVDLYSKSVGN